VLKRGWLRSREPLQCKVLAPALSATYSGDIAALHTLKAVEGSTSEKLFLSVLPDRTTCANETLQVDFEAWTCSLLWTSCFSVSYRIRVQHTYWRPVCVSQTAPLLQGRRAGLGGHAAVLVRAQRPSPRTRRRLQHCLHISVHPLMTGLNECPLQGICTLSWTRTMPAS
jgi:hypothetical protein